MAEDKNKEAPLPQPDKVEVYAKRLLEFAKANQTAITVAVSAVVLVAIVVAGVIYFQKQAEEKAQAMLGKAIAQAEAVRRGQAPEARYAEIKPKFEEIIQNYGSTAAGKAALLKYADLCYQTGDYDTAIEMYQSALDAYKEGGIKSFVLNGLAYAYESKEAYAQAAEYFNRIVTDGSAIMKDQALFNLGRIYGKMGKPEKQRNAYNRIVSDYPNSMYYQLAKEKLAG
ncbi:MAG: tetratricopeptide repeat protein [Desulfobacterales bacterium]|nr:tetratricopeptide repeat protein [Desulfobacterales bacterium]